MLFKLQLCVLILWILSPTIEGDISTDFPASIYHEITAPNAFAPNGNNVFRLQYEGAPEEVLIESFEIHNRWGNLVFEGRGAIDSIAWDGKKNGTYCKSDVYIWTATVLFFEEDTEEFSGQFALIR